MKAGRKKLFGWAIGFVAALSVAVLSGHAVAAEVTANEDVSIMEEAAESYVYAVVPEDEEWNEMETVEEKVEACRIAEDDLESMTDEQLIRAILDYPFIYDIFAYSDYATGVNSLQDICDAYAELLSRSTALESLLLEVESRPAADEVQSSDEEIENDILAALILFQDEFQGQLSQEEMELVAEVSNIPKRVE